MSDAELRQKNRKTVTTIALVVVGMFGFGFALVPLYEVFCEITGLNGKTGGRYEISEASTAVNEQRLVRVQFITSNNEMMPWEFRPVLREVKAHPGAQKDVEFYARNPTDRRMVAQAVPSVSPALGAAYFHKTECFCFNRQVLEPGEEILMPLRFVIDQELPEELTTLTLSYTLFELEEDVAENETIKTNNS